MQAVEKHVLENTDREDDQKARPTDRADELPVLSAVVRTGNASIIQSHRLGHQVLDELETLRLVPRQLQPPEPLIAQQDLSDRFSVLGDLVGSFDETIDFEQPDFAPGIDASFSRRDAEATMTDDQIELMVEALIDRHVSELRSDIRSLLSRARQTH